MRALLIALLVCAGCGGAENNALSAEGRDYVDASELTAPGNFEPEDPLPGVGDLQSAFSFTVKSGHHHSNHDFIARPHLGHTVNRGLQFTAVFSSSAAYTTSNASNQSDWNKLMGISTDRIHKNSIRIGWRWNPASQRIELGYYGYMDDARTMVMLTDVAIGQSVNCSLQMTNGGMTATANGVSHTVAGGLGVSLPLTWILHSVYFGGDETAPHDIGVNVTNIQAQ